MTSKCDITNSAHQI